MPYVISKETAVSEISYIYLYIYDSSKDILRLLASPVKICIVLCPVNICIIFYCFWKTNEQTL